MGYCVSMGVSVTIPGDKVPGALQALRVLMGRANTDGSGGTRKLDGEEEKWYSWVDTNTVLESVESDNLVEALAEWRYEAESEELSPTEKLVQAGVGNVYSDVVVTGFNGEKLGDDEELWFTLAPYVTEDSEIDCTGEDDCRWLWTFVGGVLENKSGMNVWCGSEDDPEILRKRIRELEEELETLKNRA